MSRNFFTILKLFMTKEKKYPEIGERLKQARKHLRLGAGEFAALLRKKSANTLNSYLNGFIKPSEDMYDILENNGISRTWLKTGEGEMLSKSNVSLVENAFETKMVDLNSLSTEQLEKILEVRRNADKIVNNILEEV